MLIFNPFTGTLDYISTSNQSTVSIPEFVSDPVNPSSQTVWVLAQDTGAIGTPIGLLMSLTHAISTFNYYLSYRTNENTTIRTVLK